MGGFYMTRKTVLIIFVFMGFLSCGKPETGGSEFEDFSKLTEETRNYFKQEFLRELAPFYGLWKVRLANGAIIGKVKSADKEYSERAMDEAYLGINSEDDYDIIIINAEDDAYKTILRDKYRNIKLLPVFYNRRTTETIDDRCIITRQSGIHTPFFKCFLLQTMEHDNSYKLIYLDNIDHNIDNIIRRDYEYESAFTPDDAEITITPNYFIVYHQGHYTVRDADNYYNYHAAGEEYILINKKTGEYSVIDMARIIDTGPW
jgi:hypothetical protein